jgi:hypothetical protein
MISYDHLSKASEARLPCNIYNLLFYNVYYGVIGKRCFTPRWRCVSYMEIAPLLHRSTFGLPD